MTDPIILPDGALPDDVFHVIADITNIIKLMPPEHLAFFSGGRPPWAHYEGGLEDDPKSWMSGWRMLCAAAHEVAIQILDGDLPNPLEVPTPPRDTACEFAEGLERAINQALAEYKAKWDGRE